MTPIQLFVPRFRTDECLEEIRECLERGWTGLGYKTGEVEEEWKAYTGLPHAHFLNSATAALHISLALLKSHHGWQDGDEVISTPLTFVSTNHAILYNGLKPVFADVDDYLCLDPDSVMERITPNTRAVLFVGLAGNTGQLERVSAICRERELALILDAAHMAGTKLREKDAGHLADVTCYSFQAVKNLPTADSGMVCFASEELDKQARQFAWLGISKDTYSRWHSGAYSWKYDVDMVGYKYHGNSIIASLAKVGLRYLDEDNTRRRQLAAVYDAAFAGEPAVRTTPTPEHCLPSRHIYQIRCDARDALIGYLQHNDVFPGVHYRSNGDYLPYLDQRGLCPTAELASEQLISLPLHLELSEDQVARVAGLVKDFLGDTNPPPLPGESA